MGYDAMKKIIKFILILAAALFLSGGAALALHFCFAEGEQEKVINIGHSSVSLSMDMGDLTDERINPLHGVNNGPRFDYEDGTFSYDAVELFREAGIPYVRLHDVEYPYGKDKFIDIHCIFPDPDADPKLESSYNFKESDEYIEAIIESGASILFRLGESIDHTGDALYISPPEDYQKWAQVCEGIINHYNHGFADGFEYGIEYFEIWNEPDNQAMWVGSQEEYFELYSQVSVYLKEKFPYIKIGGYAATDPGLPYMEEFLNHISADEDVPLDFFSWHLYNKNPYVFSSVSEIVREKLDSYGYTETEIILDEWSYNEEFTTRGINDSYKAISSNRGAAYVSSVMIELQNKGISKAMYYDANLLGVWCCLYEDDGSGSLKTLPAYNSFAYYDRLYELGSRIHVNAQGSGNLHYLAAGDGKDAALLVTNYEASGDWPAVTELSLEVKGGSFDTVKVSVTDREHPEGYSYELDIEDGELKLRIEEDSLALIEFYGRT